MKAIPKFYKIIISPIYYLIHRNFFFGFLHKIIFRYFYYRSYKFDLKDINLPLDHYSSFLWKTYELNDRVLVERNLNSKNHCIIIGGGLGFIGTIAYHKTKNKILCFEINQKIINILKKNFKNNNVKNELYNKNLSFTRKNKNKYYFSSDNFLENSIYRSTKNKIYLDNIYKGKITNFKKFNTLIIDGEGIEDHYIKNLKFANNIKYIYFEFHHDLLNKKQQKKLFKILNKNKFYLRDKFINSFYFKKN